MEKTFFTEKLQVGCVSGPDPLLAADMVVWGSEEGVVGAIEDVVEVEEGRVEGCEEAVVEDCVDKGDDVPLWLKHVSFESEGESEEIVRRHDYASDDKSATSEEEYGHEGYVEGSENQMIETHRLEDESDGDNDNDSDSDDERSNYYKSKADNSRGPCWEMRSEIKDVDIGLYSTFRDPDVFRLVFKSYAAEQGFAYDFVKNDRKRIVIMCFVPGCHFWCYASKIGNSSVMQIVTWVPEHNCGHALQNHQITSDFIAFRFLPEIRKAGKMKARALKDLVNEKLTVTVCNSKIYRALNKAKEMISGNLAEQYADLLTYCEMIKDKNIGSKTTVQYEEGGQARFQRLYVRYAAQKQGLLEGMRPYVGLDGCHLKGRFGGHLLSAIGRDGNDGMYPLAIAVVGQENKESWRWFLTEFFQDYGWPEDREWVFVSDKQKGLVQLFLKEWPAVEHRFCMRHMADNFYAKFRDENLKFMLWDCARSTSRTMLKENMQILKARNPKAYEWVEERSPKEWCKAYYTKMANSSEQTNNLSEAFNRWILEAREKPIYELLEDYRTQLMKLLSNKSDEAKKWKGKFCPKVKEKLEKNKLASSKCTCIHSGNNIFEVTDGASSWMVNLEQKSCDCLEWQLNGIPCQHSVAAMRLMRHAPEDYVEWYYLVDTYKAVYSHYIKPVDSKDKWPTDLGLPRISPPNVRKPPGRPRIRRKQSVGEKLLQMDHAARRTTSVKCTNCNRQGHNKQSCSAKDHGQSSSTKKRKHILTEAEVDELYKKRRERINKRKTSSKKCTPVQIEAKRQAAVARKAQHQASQQVSQQASRQVSQQLHQTSQENEWGSWNGGRDAREGWNGGRDDGASGSKQANGMDS